MRHLKPDRKPRIITAEDAWEELIRGNQLFVAGKRTPEDFVLRRTELVIGQQPFATILACSDSRVSPELLFDQGLGDVFVVRTAGNVVDNVVIGSIEYATLHLHTPLLVVLGHQSCGAVTAAVNNDGEGKVRFLLKQIKPAVNAARETRKEGNELIEETVDENVKLVIKGILERSQIVREAVKSRQFKIIGAKYFLDSGKVEMIKNTDSSCES